jgi:perosamine synthetase
MRTRTCRISVCEPYLSGNELKYAIDAIETGWISSSGKYVTLFEEKFAEYCGASHASTACNGTAALHLALIAADIGAGDEVIIPDFTMAATAFAVCYLGAKPVFVDAHPNTWNIDPDHIAEKITEKTKALLVTSIFGNPCEMKKFRKIAEKNNLILIEDAAESIGAEYDGKKTGNLADITAFSFYANKNITTGEGGMVVTNDAKMHKKVNYFKNMCFPLNGKRVYIHNDIGFNYRLSNVLCAIGLAQLEKADFYRICRIKNSHLYKKYLRNIPGIIFQKDTKKGLNVHWMNSIIIDEKIFGHSRDDLMAFLDEMLIETRLLFTGMHRQPSLKKYLGNPEESGQYPVSDNLADNGFYLPSGSALTKEGIESICGSIQSFYESSSD